MSPSNTRLGILKFGMPYLKTPPGLLNDSKIATLYPILESSTEATSPQGPDPIMATLSFKVGILFFLDIFDLPKSETYLSNALIEIGADSLFRMHTFSQGAEHILPHIEGKGLFSFICS